MKTLIKMSALCLLVFIGINEAEAQRRNRGNSHKGNNKEYRRSSGKHSNRGNSDRGRSGYNKAGNHKAAHHKGGHGRGKKDVVIRQNRGYDRSRVVAAKHRKHRTSRNPVRVNRGYRGNDVVVINNGGHGHKGNGYHGRRPYSRNRPVKVYRDVDHYYTYNHITHSTNYCAPVGVRVRRLPRTYFQISFHGNPYFFVNGAFYRNVYGAGYYEVVQPPVGAIVPALPAGVDVVFLNHHKYYVLGGYYYQEVITPGNRIGFQVVSTVGW